MSIELYPDQKELIDATRLAMTRNKSVLMQACTGFGKTVCTSFMVQTAVSKGKRAMMVMPRRQLVKQTSATFSDIGIDHSFIASGYGYNPFSTAYVATTDTLARRLDKAPPLDLLICDETHYAGNALDKIIKHYKSQGSYIVGLSATPWRTDGRGLKCWYDEMVCGKPMRWLIENKRLSDYRLFSCNHPDLSGIKTEYQLNEKMENDRVLIGDAVKHYRDHAMGRLNVCFCTSIKHSEIVAQKFNDEGIPAASVSGETPEDQLMKIIKAFARREILVLTSCDLLVFGFDLASYSGVNVTVECLSDLAPTESLAKQMQKWGRALRYKDFPAMIFDHSGNVCDINGIPKHNVPAADRSYVWTLEDREKSSRLSKERIVPCRTCPKCDFTSPPRPVCEYCGFTFPIQSREIDEIDGELKEITEVQLKMDKKKRRAACKTIEELVKFAEQEGYASPRYWAAKHWTIRQQYARGGR